MMFGIHSKLLFSIFASTKLKKDVEKRNFTHQYGTKKAGSETMHRSTILLYFNLIVYIYSIFTFNTNINMYTNYCH